MLMRWILKCYHYNPSFFSPRSQDLLSEKHGHGYACPTQYDMDTRTWKISRQDTAGNMVTYKCFYT